MKCYCCESEVNVGRKVKLRRRRDYDFSLGGAGSAAYQSYCEEMTYRWSVVCLPCYRALDSFFGVAEIDGRRFGIAGKSRFDKAAVVTEAKWQAFLKKEAAKLGLDLS